jgi:hypothetical protein
VRGRWLTAWALARPSRCYFTILLPESHKIDASYLKIDSDARGGSIGPI